MLSALLRASQRLTFRIVGLGLAMLVLGLVARYVIGNYVLYSSLQDSASKQLVSLAQYVAKDIHGKVSVRLRLLERLSATMPPELLRDPDRMERWLAQHHGTAPLFSLGLVAMPISGLGAVADFPVITGRRQLDFSDRDWFQATKTTNQAVIGSPTIGQTSGKQEVSMAVALRDGQGRMVGVLMGVTALDATGFLDLIQATRFGNGGSMRLIAPRQQMIVTATDPTLRLQTFTDPARGAGVAAGAQAIQASAAVVSADWVVVAILPTSEIQADVARLQSANLLTTALAGLAVVFLVVVLLQRMLKPLRDSARRMRSMATGGEALAPLPTCRRDEVGDMVESFNLLVQQIQRAESTMAHAAHHDALTGLPNRFAILEQMHQSLALAARQNHTLAVLFVDLDGFKQINDLHGHQTGDLVLQTAADRLRISVRQSDLVGRLGGDEFLVVLTACKEEADAQASAEKIMAALSAPLSAEHRTLQVGASIGIALFPYHARTAQDLVAAADAAMYVAKRDRRGTCRVARIPMPPNSE